jgi:lipopolysaccharide transport system ATP-binding protein
MEEDIILKVENLSKQYRLGLIGTGTISHDLNRFWAKIRGKEDPYLKIGESNDRSKKGTSEYVWVLKDINFEVKRGEVLGIIGKNGAGKSTLLKILSRVTGPTTGAIKSRGRIASLLEVGTGFHPEMTGKENIFLNGAILGMTKKEIANKLDEIVKFSGCERYINTPVKRYSSGMKVRLAFAVAAFLEPDILIVDEVLAVGDAEFQKKAIGKMQDISSQSGRTVLFVSHNMTAVESLCSRVIVLSDGNVLCDGEPQEMISSYVNNEISLNRNYVYGQGINIENENIKILEAKLLNKSNNQLDILDLNSEIKILFKIKNESTFKNLSLGLDLINSMEVIVFSTGHKFKSKEEDILSITIPKQLLNDDIYAVNLYVYSASMTHLFSTKEILTFEIKDLKREEGFLGKINGVIRPNLKWTNE